MLPKLKKNALYQPIDAGILAYFRILFGAIMAWEMVRYLSLGRVSYLWADPEFHFKYYGFGWVEALPGNGVHIVCIVMCVAAVGIALGCFYRACATLFAIGICYLFLIDQAKFMNHFYLMCLLGWVTVFLPAHRCFSIDALRKPKLRSDAVPAWTLWILRFQMGVVYFYGGLAKLNADWLRGEPMRLWLSERSEMPMVGQWFTTEMAPWLMSYGGLFLDLLVVPALLWKRTRWVAFAFAAFFHLANSQLFSIGIFPWLALGLTALFFDPSWPRRLIRKIKPSVGEVTTTLAPFKGRRTTIVILAVYAAFQLLFPFRHFLYPGNVSWTEEGHRFAWHMMLRSKRIEAAAIFVTIPNTQDRWLLDPSVYLTNRQYKKMLGRPDMLVQFAAHIGELMAEQGHSDAQVKAVIYASLNGHPASLLVDPNLDLTSVDRNLLPASWILPMGAKVQPPAARPPGSIDDDEPVPNSLPGNEPYEMEP